MSDGISFQEDTIEKSRLRFKVGDKVYVRGSGGSGARAIIIAVNDDPDAEYDYKVRFVYTWIETEYDDDMLDLV